MECVSISFQSVSAGERQKFFLDRKRRAAFAGRVPKDGQEGRCVVLSTCNRTEVYVQGLGNSFDRVEALLGEFAGVSAEAVRLNVMRYQGKQAVGHLFRVAAGMDSMVIGEDEILGQVREAYMEAVNKGFTGYELNTVFQAALSCAKRIRTQTKLSRTSVSVATLAAGEVFRLGKDSKTVLLIGGSGQVGSAILKNLLSRENIRVVVTSRSHKGLSRDLTGRVISADYQDRYVWLEEADAVISATLSPHYTLTADQAAKAMRTGKERLFIDVALPADIDGRICRLEGCRLLSIDDFRRLAAQNNELKRQAVLDAGEILLEEQETLFKSLLFHESAGKLSGWKDRFAGYSFEKLLYFLRDGLDSATFEAVLKALDRQEK